VANPHLSVFHPYHVEGHEDQLTRGALIVMKLVPLAHDAFLGLADAPKLGDLPTPRFDMQTGQLTLPEDSQEREPGTPHVESFISVFLGPHEALPSHEREPDLASPRRARYDGVIQYGFRALVVIESKLFEGSPDWQSLAINAAGLEAGVAIRALVRWNDLIDSWWRLTELDVLSPAERSVLNDFFDFAEEGFAWLLPYTTLERCGDNAQRRRRRLRSILEELTGLEGVEGLVGEVYVKFPSDRVTSVQRAALRATPSEVLLETYPAELAPQARHVYEEPSRVEALIELSESDGWSLEPNFHVSYFRAPWYQRWYTTPRLSGPDYLRSWVEDLDKVGRYPRKHFEDPVFWRWLLDRGYAQEGDKPGLEELLARNVQEFDVRPSVKIARRWTWTDAVALDSRESGHLVSEVRDSLEAVLVALDEPSLDNLRP
jgi:hypothetical protein